MKSKVLIISFLLLSLLGAFVLTARSQQPHVYGSKEGNVAKIISSKDSTKELIADETWLTYTKTGAKIISYSESAFKAISLQFGEDFKAIHIYYKNDRNGSYKEYVIHITFETANRINLWALKNL